MLYNLLRDATGEHCGFTWSLMHRQGASSGNEEIDLGHKIGHWSHGTLQ